MRGFLCRYCLPRRMGVPPGEELSLLDLQVVETLSSLRAGAESVMRPMFPVSHVGTRSSLQESGEQGQGLMGPHDPVGYVSPGPSIPPRPPLHHRFCTRLPRKVLRTRFLTPRSQTRKQGRTYRARI